MTTDDLTTDDTQCARTGHTPAGITQSSVPPIWQTAAFDIDGLRQLDQLADDPRGNFIYTRDGNPNHQALAASIARLESAEDGAVTASGMAAISAVLLSLVQPGQHVVASDVLYGRTRQLLDELAQRWQIEVSYVPATDLDAVRAALRADTRVLLIESISNPLMEVADIAALAELCDATRLVVDNTFASPALLKPLRLGADVVVHSVSKYINGHGDLMLGSISGSAKDLSEFRDRISIWGMNANPFDCWLAMRGLRTLPLRMERHSRSAAAIAERLQQHPSVTRVYYPDLSGHPSRAAAQRLLTSGCGGMLSFEMSGGREVVDRFMQHASQIPFSPTLADVRTTVSYPWGTSHKFLPEPQRLKVGITDGLVRLSVGLEDLESLWGEIESALTAAAA